MDLGLCCLFTDQERVLHMKFHTISLPSGELHLTVSLTKSPQNPDQPSTSQAQVSEKCPLETSDAFIIVVNTNVRAKLCGLTSFEGISESIFN